MLQTGRESEQSSESRLTDKELSEAIRYARRYAESLSRQIPRVDAAHIESVAVARAWEAWKRYDPNKGVAWHYWLRKYVQWTRSDVTRERSKAKRAFQEEFSVISLDDTQSGAESKRNVRSFGETVADPNGCLFERAVEMRDLLDQLQPEQRAVLEQRFFENKSQKEVGRALGIRQAQVSRVEREALTALRELYVADGEADRGRKGAE